MFISQFSDRSICLWFILRRYETLWLFSVEWWNSEWMMNRKGCGSKWSWYSLRYCSNIYLDWVRKPKKSFRWLSWGLRAGVWAQNLEKTRSRPSGRSLRSESPRLGANRGSGSENIHIADATNYGGEWAVRSTLSPLHPSFHCSGISPVPNGQEFGCRCPGPRFWKLGAPREMEILLKAVYPFHLLTISSQC
jgi:hypothetical protein